MKLNPKGWIDRSNLLRFHTIPEIKRCFVKNDISVQVSFLNDLGFGEIIHLWVARKGDKPLGWSQLQRIKNEIVGPEFMGIEVFPKETQKIDQANMYHIWVFTEFQFDINECGFKF